jgi:hypothetical protein
MITISNYYIAVLHNALIHSVNVCFRGTVLLPPYAIWKNPLERIQGKALNCGSCFSQFHFNGARSLHAVEKTSSSSFIADCF